MGNTLLTAIALMLILEGCVPLFAPALWREVFRHLTAMRDGQIRTIGLSVTLGGIALLILLSL
ncbi:MAG: DUF2065 domain-containing protein [Betaproteobacteria bacterium]|jgi:uncharacterized protein YjeT (DUF2065 family)|nr:DUF2065 domain-containing protein [Betaproteobacteria bacterium]